MNPPFQSFRSARWLRSTNLLLQAILFVALFAGLNQLARDNSWRFDLTQLRRHSLSPETLAYLHDLGKNQPDGQPLLIRLVNTYPKDPAATTTDPEAPPDLDQINADLDSLIREYTYALETNTHVRLQVENTDVYKNPLQARQLDLRPYTILLTTGAPPDEHRREIKPQDLYQIKNNQRAAFLGEQAITAALLAITNPKKTKIYLITGHGEMDINSTNSATGLSDLRDTLRDNNYTLDTLDLPRAPRIPADADTGAGLLISIGATTRYEPYEQELLRDYMNTRAGRILLCTTPGTAPTGLENLLAEWGILATNAYICDRDPASANQQLAYGDLILSNYDPRHPVTQPLYDKQIVLRFGASRPARPDPARATDPGLTITPLVLTGTTAFASRTLPPRRTPRPNPAIDLPGPLPIVTVAEKVAPKNKLPFSVPVGRIIVIGNSDFLANRLLRTGANTTLALSAINWLVERDANLNIPPRPVEKFQLALTHDQLARLRRALLFGVPGAFALIGLIVYWTRRR